MANIRADQHLAQIGLAPSRTKAKELIGRGSVEILLDDQWTLVRTASQLVDSTSEMRITGDELLKYVSRSGLKLEGAIDQYSLDVTGLRCVDIGQSTGGFTDCLLQRGASFVLGVDVGKGQLHSSLKESPRVQFFENCNVKDIGQMNEIKKQAASFDLLVCDLSFISLKKALEPVLFLLKPKSSLVVLVKPQFELGKKALNKQGIVKIDNLQQVMQEDFYPWIEGLGFEPKGFIESKVRGHNGNQEYLLYATKMEQ